MNSKKIKMNSSVGVTELPKVQMVELFRDRGSEGIDSNHSEEEEEVVELGESDFSGSGESKFHGAVDGIIAQFENKAEKNKVISETDQWKT